MDTNNIAVIRDALIEAHSAGKQGKDCPFTGMAERIERALSARASAGEGGPSCPAIDADKPTDPDSKRLAALADWMDILAPGRSLSARTYLLELSRRLAAPQPAQAGASGGMTFAFMAEVCDAAVQAMQANGLIKRTIRLQEVRDQLRQLAAAPQPQEVQRPSADWYRRKIMQGDGVEAMAGPLPPFHVCSNPSARHRHGADPMGHCPDCVAQGLGNWSCTPESPTPPAHGEGEVVLPELPFPDTFTSDSFNGMKLYFTAEQMREYARLALTTRPTPEAQEARDAVDARRYRYLRDHCKREWYSDMPHNKGAPSLDIEFEARGHDLDAAIDAALALPAQGEGR